MKKLAHTSIAALVEQGASQQVIQQAINEAHKIGICVCCKQSARLNPRLICNDCTDRQNESSRMQVASRRLPDALRDAAFTAVSDISNIPEVKKRLKTLAGKRASVYHFGGVGAGKTTLNAAVYRGLAVDRNVWWTTFSDIVDQVYATFKNNSRQTQGSVIAGFVGQARGGILFVDDLGAHTARDKNVEILHDLIEGIYNHRNQACVWFTSNYSLLELGRWLGSDIEAQRIISRLTQLIGDGVVHNKSGDWRMNKSHG